MNPPPPPNRTRRIGLLVLAALLLLLLVTWCGRQCRPAEDNTTPSAAQADSTADTSGTQADAPADIPSATPHAKAAYRARVSPQTNSRVDVQTLFRGVRNDLRVRVWTEPGGKRIPGSTVTATDAEVIATGGGDYAIVPRSLRTRIRVIAPDGTVVHDQEYVVRDTPRPELRLEVDGSPVARGARVRRNSQMVLRVVPDPEFRAVSPRDAQYQILKVTLKKAGGLTAPPPRAPNVLGQRIESVTVEMSKSFRAALRSGDKIFVEAEKVNRLGARNALYPEAYSTRELTYDLVVAD